MLSVFSAALAACPNAAPDWNATLSKFDARVRRDYVGQAEPRRIARESLYRFFGRTRSTCGERVLHFTGPSGSGKSFLAQITAEAIFDAWEYELYPSMTYGDDCTAAHAYEQLDLMADYSHSVGWWISAFCMPPPDAYAHFALAALGTNGSAADLASVAAISATPSSAIPSFGECYNSEWWPSTQPARGEGLVDEGPNANAGDAGDSAAAARARVYAELGRGAPIDAKMAFCICATDAHGVSDWPSPLLSQASTCGHSRSVSSRQTGPRTRRERRASLPPAPPPLCAMLSSPSPSDRSRSLALRAPSLAVCIRSCARVPA